jgi:hypothetical protein
VSSLRERTVHWDADRRLLFIHSSNHKSFHDWLARAAAGDDVALLHGEPMFRGFHGMHRLVLMNLGLKHTLSRNVQFTMYVGSDILEQLPDAAQVNKIESNMFGHGYDSGRRASYGCSYRGRAWSYRRAADISEWVDWCHEVGAKLIDEGITTDTALRFALIPERVGARPNAVPLSVMWPIELLAKSEDLVEFQIGDVHATLVDTSIEVVDPKSEGPIRFRVFTVGATAEYEVAFTKEGVSYRPIGATDVHLVQSHRTRPLTDLFSERPPDINFSDGSFLVGDALFRLRKEYRPPFGRDGIGVLDWTGVDIQKESQGLEKRPDSVQRRVIETLIGAEPRFQIVFDDDDPGESADIVALRVDGARLVVQLFHCKFSGGAQPGARVVDLYTVCGQAQTSVSWRGDIERLLEHLERREAGRRKAGKPSRFEVGDQDVLRSIRRRLHELSPVVEIIAVQPGLSRASASDDQLELLAVTQMYLLDTFAVPLRVIGSA